MQCLDKKYSTASQSTSPVVGRRRLLSSGTWKLFYFYAPSWNILSRATRIRTELERESLGYGYSPHAIHRLKSMDFLGNNCDFRIKTKWVTELLRISAKRHSCPRGDPGQGPQSNFKASRRGNLRRTLPENSQRKTLIFHRKSLPVLHSPLGALSRYRLAHSAPTVIERGKEENCENRKISRDNWRRLYFVFPQFTWIWNR